MSHVTLTFKPSGTVTGLYTELIPLHQIGALKIHRLTEIEFNNETQRWVIKDRAGSVLFSHESREACLAWEHRQFNP